MYDADAPRGRGRERGREGESGGGMEEGGGGKEGGKEKGRGGGGREKSIVCTSKCVPITYVFDLLHIKMETVAAAVPGVGLGRATESRVLV